MYVHGRRFFVLSIFALAAFPLTLILIQRVNSKVLYAGDRSENRLCRECQGSGKGDWVEGAPPQIAARCPACGGDGLVEVIIPGPNRPTRVQGMLADKDLLTPYATFRQVRPPLPGQPRLPGGSVQGIAGARVRFVREDGHSVEVESNPLGLFPLTLLPGSYRVTAEAPGFEVLEGKLEVSVLTEEIWLEEARILRESRTSAEAQARHGLELLLGLARSGSGKGILVSCFGGS